jgi:CBS domain-containing protein
LAKSE